MTRTAARAAMLFVAASSVAALAQTPNFSGTWRLNRDASQITTAAGLADLGGGGTPETLHITHAANGTLTVSSEHNESQARAYTLAGESSIPVGQGGTMTVTSRWDGSRLVTEGSQEFDRGGSTITGVKRVLSLSADGQTLTLEVTTTTGRGENTSTLLYTKLQVVEPCQNWSTPCRER